MARLPHVALLIETSWEVGRGLLQGVGHYIREQGPWSVYFRPMDLDATPPPWLKDWHGDGILVRIGNRKMANAILETGLPAIDLRKILPGLPLPHVGVNQESVVQLALEHLLDRGLRHFGFCGTPRRRNSIQDFRCHRFKELVEQAGYSCSVLQIGYQRRRATTWEHERELIAAWAAELPKPIGVMCGDDEYGLKVLDGCRRVGVLVPDQVAVVAAGNDEYLCRLSNPPLTSVDFNPEQIGYQAAALLDRMMAGQPPPEDLIDIEPRGVATRQSTDMLAVDDHQVAAALRFIREHAYEGISVAQVTDSLDLSYSTLEHRFKKVLGRTPKAEILRLQLDQAKELLARTNLSVAAIARKSGFTSPEYFSETFHKKVGVAPGVYRSRFKKLD